MNLPIYMVAFIFFGLYATFIFKVELPKLYFKIIILLLLIAVIILAYNYIPAPSNDLARYYQMLNQTRSWNWQQYQNYANYRDTPLTNLYFYIMKDVSNRSLFATIPTITVMFFLAGTVHYFDLKFNLKTRSIVIYLLSTLSFATIVGIISGVRQNVSWVFLMIAIFYDFYSDKKNKIFSVFLYILPPLIHLSTIPVIALRVLYMLIKKLNILKYLVILWPIFISAIHNITDLFPPQVQLALEKLELSVREVEWDLRQIIALIGYLLILFVLLRARNNLYQRVITKNYLNFYILVVLFGLSSFFAPTLFRRTFGFVLYISLPLFADVVERSKKIDYLSLAILLTLLVYVFYSTDFISGVFIT